jgi:hypothetical protein
LSKRPAHPYRTVADSAAARCLHRGGWAVSERYPRSGDSEFTPAGKPFVTRAHGPLWSTRFAGQIGSLPLVRAIPDQAIPCTFIGKHLRFSDDDIAQIMAEGARQPVTRARGTRR